MIRVMCLGRVVAGDVLKAFEKGAAGVMMVGCSDDTCHHGFGSRAAHENLGRVVDILSLLGIARERLRITQAPTENAPNLCDVVKDFRTRIEGLGTLEKEI
jgi:heterodisulfide reductase subunit A/F420-non-reducing hydrogenase iron-sulfur subunit